MTEQDYSADSVHRYAVVNTGGGFSSRVTVDGRDVEIKSDKGMVVVKGSVAAEIDKLCAIEEHGFSRSLRKIDMVAAHAQAAAFLAKQRDAAAKGPFSTEAFSKIRAEIAEGSNALLGEAAPNNPAAIAELKRGLLGEDLELTERVDVNAMDKPTPTVDAPAITAAGGMQLNLGKTK